MTLQEVFEAILSVTGVSVYCGIIVICTFVGGIFLYKKINLLRKNLEYAINLISSRKEEPEGFISEFNDFSQEMQNIKKLEHHWKEFNETLIYPSSFEEKPKICNTVAADDFFNQSSLIGEQVDLRFYNSLPNILTGLGILGTFIGLVAGIYIAKEGLVSGNIDKLNNSLHGLLNGASLAFFTSITGIFCSIIFSFFEKGLVHRCQQKINIWNQELDKRICRITSESIAKKQLIQLEKQTELNEGLANQLAFEISNVIGQVFDQGMDQKLLPAIEKLTGAVEELGKNQKQDNEDFMREMVTEFKQFLSASAGKEMQALTNTLGTMREGLGSLIERMGETQSELSEATKQIGDTLKEGSTNYINNMEESMKTMLENVAEFGEALRGEFKTGVEEALNKLDAASRNLGNNVDQLDRTSSSLNTVLEHTSNLIYDFQLVATSLRETREGMQKTVESMDQITQNLHEHVENSAKASVEINESISNVKEIQKRYHELQDQINDIWEGYATRFENVDKDLEHIFDTVHRGVEQFVASTQKYLESLDTHASSVTSTFGGAVEELRELIEEIPEQMSNR